jgi:hypothetical protein
MVVQFLGHVEGCLEWFDPANCATTPTPTPTPTPACACDNNIGMGTGSTNCAENECCADCNCVPGYWVMDVGDCVCQIGDIPEGFVLDPPVGVLLNDPNFGNYVWSNWGSCCEERNASGFPPCQGYNP